MTATREDLELLEAARAAARAACALLATARPEAIRSKGNAKDLVTEWDLRAEQLLRDVLAERTPGVPVLGEEAGLGEGAAAAAGELQWIVDPIDGTVNFAHGLPIWCVSVAVARGGEVLAGVVAAPVLGWWFEAARGDPARDGTGAPLAVSAIDQLGQALLATGFPYDLATNPANNFAEWEHLQRHAGACRRLGSAALDLCLVARGSFEGYWERHVKPWDIAAGALIALEAGGTVTDTHGAAFNLFGGEVVASNGAIHEELIAELGRVQRSR